MGAETNLPMKYLLTFLYMICVALLVAYAPRTDTWAYIIFILYGVGCVAALMQVMHSCCAMKTETSRQRLVMKCENLMKDYIDSPSNETFTTCYTFMVLNQIKIGEVDQKTFNRWMQTSMPEGWEPSECESVLDEDTTQSNYP